MQRLRTELLALGCTEPSAATQLMTFAALIERWNRTFNLVARGDAARLLDRHILDAAQLLPLVTPGPLLDIGSGAGLPGLVLAITRPDLRVTVLDRNARKVRFMRQVVAELGLTNADVAEGDALTWRAVEAFAQITLRAVTAGPALADLICRHLEAAGVVWLMLSNQQTLSNLGPLRCVARHTYQLDERRFSIAEIRWSSQPA